MDGEEGEEGSWGGGVVVGAGEEGGKGEGGGGEAGEVHCCGGGEVVVRLRGDWRSLAPWFSCDSDLDDRNVHRIDIVVYELERLNKVNGNSVTLNVILPHLHCATDNAQIRYRCFASCPRAQGVVQLSSLYTTVHDAHFRPHPPLLPPSSHKCPIPILRANVQRRPATATATTAKRRQRLLLVPTDLRIR